MLVNGDMNSKVKSKSRNSFIYRIASHYQEIPLEQQLAGNPVRNRSRCHCNALRECRFKLLLDQSGDESEMCNSWYTSRMVDHLMLVELNRSTDT